MLTDDGPAARHARLRGDYDVLPLRVTLLYAGLCTRLDPDVTAATFSVTDPPAGLVGARWRYLTAIPTDWETLWYVDDGLVDRVYPTPCEVFPATHTHVLVSR